MGIYVYSLRKAKSPIWIDGHRVMANHWQYAWKLSSWSTPESERHENLMRGHASRAWDAYDGGFVVATHEGKVRDKYPVYLSVNTPLWSDGQIDEPGECIGVVRREGRKWVLDRNGSGC